MILQATAVMTLGDISVSSASPYLSKFSVSENAAYITEDAITDKLL